MRKKGTKGRTRKNSTSYPFLETRKERVPTGEGEKRLKGREAEGEEGDSS